MAVSLIASSALLLMNEDMETLPKILIFKLCAQKMIVFNYNSQVPKIHSQIYSPQTYGILLVVKEIYIYIL